MLRRWVVPVALLVCACGSSANDSRGFGTDGPSVATGGTGGLPVSGTGGTPPITAGGSGGFDPGADACTTDIYRGEQVPLDMLIVLDRSASMAPQAAGPRQPARPDIWGPVTDAVVEFVSTTGLDGLGGVGLTLFPVQASPGYPVGCTFDADCGNYGPCCSNLIECSPIVPVPPSPNPKPPGSVCGKAFYTPNGPGATPDSCGAHDYMAPTVNIEALGTSGPAIASAIASAAPGGTITPTLAALDGAIQYLLGRRAAGVARLPVIVLATDGRPEGCYFDSVDSTSDLAGRAYADHGLKTFVVGLGNVPGLDQIAAAGGTTQSITTSGTVKDEILDALDVIRGSVGCKYEMPQPGAGQVVDPARLNVVLTRDDGTNDVYPQVPSEAACAGGSGWYYDDPSAPSELHLCPTSCVEVESTPGTVEVLAGCVTLVR